MVANGADDKRKTTMHHPLPRISVYQVPELLPSLAAQDRHRAYSPYMSMINQPALFNVHSINIKTYYNPSQLSTYYVSQVE